MISAATPVEVARAPAAMESPLVKPPLTSSSGKAANKSNIEQPSSRQLSIQGLVTGSIPGELILDKHFGQHDFKLISPHRRSLDRRSLDRRSLTCRSLDYRSLARLPLARLPLAHMPLLTCRSLTCRSLTCQQRQQRATPTLLSQSASQPASSSAVVWPPCAACLRVPLCASTTAQVL